MQLRTGARAARERASRDQRTSVTVAGMQRASLRRVGRVWAVVAAFCGVSGCGDDLPGVTGQGSSDAGSGTSSEPTTTDPDSSGGETGPSTSGTPTTGRPPTTTEDPTTAGDATTTTDATTDPTTTDPTGAPNTAPVAVTDRYIGRSRQQLTATAVAGVLANDFDPDGDALTVVAADPLTPGGAMLTMPKDGSFAYVPPGDLWGRDDFTYKIWDGKDGFASTSVRVDLNPTAIPLGAVADGKGGFAVDGALTNDYSGRAVGRVGDMNGDGLGELVIGARSAAKNAGRVYVVFGKTDGLELSVADLEDDQRGFEIFGEFTGDFAGTAVGDAGDVNGDGVPDILIGAPKNSVNGKSSGSSYVVFGKSNSAPVLLDAIAVGDGGFSIEGEAAQHFSGQSARGAGDVNGDGLADIIVGAYGAEPHGLFSGRAYVVFGRGAGKPAYLTQIAAGTGGGFVMNGVAELDFAGSAVAGAGDVNGDGLADLVVGSYGADINGDTAGRAFVVFGKASKTPVELSAVAGGLGGFAMDGELQYDQAGAAVAGAGDVNGDGLADVIIGAPLADPNGPEAGRSYVVFGKKDTDLVQLSAVAQGTGGFAIDGQQVRDYSGFSVDGVGDMNGDGMSEVIVGAYGANPMGDASGRSYVVFGKADTDPVALFEISNGDGGFAIDGEASDDYSGFAVAGGGDVNGDGFVDVLVGAFGNDAKGPSTGRTYAVFGGDFSNLVRQTGGPGPDNLAGTPDPDVIVSGRGDDTITGQGGADIIYTGAGTDLVRVPDLAFRRIDGGAGVDTLLLLGVALNLDLSARPDDDIAGIEVLDLGDGGHTVVLTRRDLLALTPGAHELTIKGTNGSVEADLAGSGFVDGGVVDGFQIYSDGVTTLRVADGLDKNVTL